MKSRERHHSALHYAVAVGCLLFLFWATWVTARDGISSSLSRGTPEDPAGDALLDRAIQLSPSDSRPYNNRAMYLQTIGQGAEAEKNLEFAVLRRPHDYLLWLRLGDAREELNDLQGAVAAYQESARLAPSYSQSHWYLGTLLLRMGSREEAFSEMRKATTVDPKFLPHLIGYAWNGYNGDTEAVRYVVQPKSQEDYRALGDFFLEQGKTSEAMAMYRNAGSNQRDQEKLLAKLIESKAFQQAYEVWAQGRGVAINRDSAVLTNGSFENDIDPAALGFEWQINKVEKVRVARDPGEPQSGEYSLRIDFSGDSPSTRLLSQLLLVEPGSRYELTFFARTENLVTGGLPMVEVIDAGEGPSLGEAKLSGEKRSGWQPYSMQFSTTGATRAVSIIVRRQKCSSSPCPAFGKVWFDNLTWKRL